MGLLSKMPTLKPASGEIGEGAWGAVDSMVNDIEPEACVPSLTVTRWLPDPLAGGLKAVLKLPLLSVVALLVIFLASFHSLVK